MASTIWAGGISEEKAKEFIDISYEEAEKIAKEKVDKLGWDLKIYDWDYAFFYQGEHGVSADNILDGGYLFHFSIYRIDNQCILYLANNCCSLGVGIYFT